MTDGILVSDGGGTGFLQSGWRPIETAPKDGRKVLVWHPGVGLDYLVMYWMDGKWREPKDGASLASPPTHWAAVPPPPKQ